MSFAERNQRSIRMGFHLLCCTIIKAHRFLDLPQTKPESDPSDGWDDAVDKIHSYVARGKFFLKSN